MKLHVQVDEQNGQLYIGFREPASMARGLVARTVEITHDVYADLDEDGRLVGLDIAQASLAGPMDMRDITIENLVGVKEAAALLGVQKSNFIRDFADRPGFPRPVAELASGRIWLRSQLDKYLRSRAGRGRRVVAAS